MQLEIDIAQNVIEILGEPIEIGSDKIIQTNAIFFRNEKSSDLNEFIQSEKISMYVLDSIHIEAGQRVKYRGNEYHVTRVYQENGIKKLGLRCPKEHRSETILP